MYRYTIQVFYTDGCTPTNKGFDDYTCAYRWALQQWDLSRCINMIIRWYDANTDKWHVIRLINIKSNSNVIEG